jgi:hypothetical protein
MQIKNPLSTIIEAVLYSYLAYTVLFGHIGIFGVLVWLVVYLILTTIIAHLSRSYEEAKRFRIQASKIETPPTIDAPKEVDYHEQVQNDLADFDRRLHSK